MLSLGPVILLGTTWRSDRSPTTLQAQTLVLRAGSVDAATVGESVAADEGGYAAGGVKISAVSVAVQPPRGPIAAAVQPPRGPTATVVQHPRRENRCHSSDDRC